jgi:hypothetical protein
MTGTRVHDLLDDASRHLDEVDLVDTAWSGALRVRRRRRRAVAGALAGAAAAAAVVAALSLPDDPGRVQPAPRPMPTPVPSAQAPDGTVMVRMPSVAQEPRLPLHPSRLPETLDLAGPTTPLSEVRRAGGLDRVAAAYLRPVLENWAPVVVTGNGAVDLEVVLLPTSDAQGNTGAPLDRDAIAGDGSAVAFAQPGAVVLLDVASSRVWRVPVDDPHLEHVGWTVGDTGLVARSETTSWFVDPEARTVRRLPERAAPSHYEVTAREEGRASLRVWDAFGRGRGELPFRAPVTEVFGQSFTNLGGWAAAGVYLTSDVSSRLDGAYQGILAVQADSPATRRLLVAGDGQGRAKGCCPPLGWVSGHELLYRADHAEGTRLLVWDITTGEVRRVSTLTGTGPGAAPLAVALP